MRNILKYLFLFYLLSSNFVDGSAAFTAKNAKLDLRNWDGKRIITLDGEWNFFWNTFLCDSIKLEDNNSQSALLVDVPSYWNEYYIDSLKLPGKGYGTYCLTVLLPQQLMNKELALDIPVFDDSYTLYLNNERVAWNGISATNGDLAEPGYKPTVLVFKPGSEKLEIVINVSNYAHRRGGFWKSIRIGESVKIHHQKKIYEFLSHISLGIILTSMIFFSFFFIYNKKNISALFFSLSMFGILLRIISTDTFVIQIFSNPPWDWLIRFEYLGTYIAFIFASWYFHHIYPNKVARILLLLNTVLLALISMFVIVLDPVYFSYTMYYFKPVLLISFFYYLVNSFWHIFKRNENDEFYFAALLILLIALVNDIRVSGSEHGILNDYSLQFALQLFVLVQVVLTIHSLIKGYKEKEKLNLEIGYLNANLEKRIEDSQNQIDVGKSEVEKKTEEIALQNIELEIEKELTKKLRSVIHQDLRSPVNSLHQVSNYLSLSYGDGELRETINSIRDLSFTANALIDNLLFWTRCKQGEIQYSPQKVIVQDFLTELFSYFKMQIKQKSIETDVLMSEDLKCFCDPHLIKIVLRNLFSNAIKYSRKNSLISITATQGSTKDDIIIIIEDKGVGISGELLKVLNDSSNNDEIDIRKGTLNEKGSGLGIRLSQELVRINKGKMKIESNEKKGARVIVYLPGV